MLERAMYRAHVAAMAGYAAALWLADRLLGHQRARAWRAMRRQDADLARWASGQTASSILWFHCASLGEYEQARPVMAALRAIEPDRPFLLTFFSPSGHTPVARRKPEFWRKGTDHLAALPLDTPRAVRTFLRPLHGKLALFATVKYEVWPVLLEALAAAGTPTAIFAAHIPSAHWLAKWWAAPYRTAWRRFSPLLVQTAESTSRLASLGIEGAEPAGDPRADRVLEIVAQAPTFPGLQAWRSGRFTVVAGSTWPAEEAALLADPPARLVLVPHDLSPAHLAQIKQQLHAHGLKYLFTTETGGALSAAPAGDVEVVVVDEMGLLAGLYALADVAVVGGGWGVGIHNTLEPAAHGIPVMTGPNIARFQEAQNLRESGALRVAEKPENLMREAKAFASDAGEKALAFVASSRGSAERIAKRLQQVI